MITIVPLLNPISDEIKLPGDKSISHRALIFSAIAAGITHIRHILQADDCKATAHAFTQMGVEMVWEEDAVYVHGVGLRGLLAPQAPIDCGNSGTTMRLLAGILAGQAFDSVLLGDMSLSMRPMMRIVKPLSQMGAKIMHQSGCAPLYISGQQSLKGITYIPPEASAQVKSCVLLAGLYATGETQVIEPVQTRNHTEEMQPFFLNTTPHTRVFSVPGDLSSAAFLMVLSVLVPGSRCVFPGVLVDETRTGVIDILRAMGADITLHCVRQESMLWVADIEVRASPLEGVFISRALLVRAIDEFPILLIAAACARGVTRIEGVEELRYKESDRIAVMLKGLKNLGIQASFQLDSVLIEGSVLTGGTVDAHDDHRVAMAFLIAGAVANAPVQVLNTSAISTSFPAFLAILNRLGCQTY